MELTNVLYWGDCLDILPDLPDDSMDMILVDPPYGITALASDVMIPCDAFWREHNRVIKDNGAVIVLAAQPFASELVMSNRRYFRYDLVWLKNKSTSYLNARRMPLRQHELILVFYKKLPVYNPQKTSGHSPVKNRGDRPRRDQVYGKAYRNSGYGQTDRYPTSLVKFDVVNNDDPDRKYPNQKPVDLLRWLIRTYTNPGDVVLDSCLGSGSTVIAALRENRRFIGIELDHAMYRSAVSRINQVL